MGSCYQRNNLAGNVLTAPSCHPQSARTMNNVTVKPHRTSLLQIDLVVGQQQLDDFLAAIPACGN